MVQDLIARLERDQTGYEHQDPIWETRLEAATMLHQFRKALQHAQWCRVCAEGSWDDCPEGQRALKLLGAP